MPKLLRVKRQNMYEQVIEHLKRYITENRLRPGDKLPTELDLAEQLGVNRLTVREALKVMESLGIVQIRPRHGIQLQAVTMKPVVDHLQFLLRTQDVAFAELLDARCMLEVALLPLVAERADEADFRKLEESNEWMRALVERGDDGIDADIMFHQALAAASKNRVVEGFSSLLQEFFTQVRARVLASEEDSRRAIEQHREIYEALRRGEVERAQGIMEGHLRHYEQFLGPAWSLTAGRKADPPAAETAGENERRGPEVHARIAAP